MANIKLPLTEETGWNYIMDYKEKKNPPHFSGLPLYMLVDQSQQALFNYEIQMGRDQMTDKANKGLINRGL